MATLTLKSPSTRFDLMTYCSPEWISDYVYEKVMQNRQGSAGAGAPGFGIGSGASTWAGAGGVAAGGISGSGNSGPSLLVWGRVENGQVILEPAFIVDAPPQLPANPGAYTVEGLDTTGGRLFAFSFEPIPVADATLGEGHFAFTVPTSAFPNGDLVELRVTGDGSVSGIQRSSFDGVPGGAATPAAVAAQASVTAGPGGTVDLEWDAAQYPMALIRDAETGEILSFARGGSASFIPVSDRVELLFSDGIRSSERLIRSWR